MTLTTTHATRSMNGTGSNLTARELEESVGNLPVLGYSVQWNLSHVETEHTDLVNALLAAGFNTADPERPSPTIALRRAIIKWVQHRAVAGSLSYVTATSAVLQTESFSENEDEDDTGASSGKGGSKASKSLLRKINSPHSDWLVFSLVSEQLDLTELGLSYATRLRVFLHKKTLAIRVSQAETGVEPDNLTQGEGQAVEQQESDNEVSQAELEMATITDEIRQLFYYYREHHQARDISVLLKQLVSTLDSFSLRRLGGVYFVPQQHRTALDNLRKLVADLPAIPGQVSDTFMLQLPILDGLSAKKQLAQAAYHDFLQELTTLQSDLDHLTEESTQRQLRPDTVARRLTTYRELKAKAEVYADLLDMQQERIITAVERLTGQAIQLLDVLNDFSLQHSDHQQFFDWESLSAGSAEEQIPQLKVTEVPA